MANKLLENILSFKNETKYDDSRDVYDVHKVIKFLGFKISYKKYEYSNNLSKLLEYYIFFSWQTLQGSKFGEQFGFNIQNLELAAFWTKTKLPKNLRLVIISMFIEDKAYSKVDYLLQNYLNDYGECDLHEWLVISNYMIKNKLTENEKIINASRLYEIFDEAEKNEILSNYLKNKKVAVVGNGPCEIGKNKGKEIDSHDVVLRFNDYSTNSEFEQDYGKKLDIWFFGIALDPNMIDRADFSKLKYLLVPPFKTRCFTEAFTNKMLEIHKKGIIIDSITTKCLAEASESINTNFPTAGFVWLEYLDSIIGKENINIYGFNFLDENVDCNELDRYFTKREAIKCHSWHNFAKETEFLKANFK